MNDGNAPDPPEAADGERREWRFTLEDIETRKAEVSAEAEAQKRREEPIEPGDPSLEGIVFVLLGGAFTLFVISRLFLG